MTDPDSIKALSAVMEPDPRQLDFSIYNPITGDSRPIELDDRLQAVKRYVLQDSVPQNVTIQYDVARNLYVYAWFAYRFYNVAEMQALMALEFGLRERIAKRELKKYIRDREKDHVAETGKKLGLNSGLKVMIEYCRDKKLIRNDQFSAWHNQPRKQAQWDMDMAAIEKMETEGLNEIEVDYSQAQFAAPDDSYDHVQNLVDHVNKIRNSYAHGSSMLHTDVLGTFEMVSEFLNALYVGDLKT